MYNDDCFEYPALTETEINAQKALLPEGFYNFETMDASSKTSSTGNRMAQLKQKLWDSDGKEHIRTDWLIGIPTMAWKTKHYWESVGKPEKYTGKTPLPEFVGNSGVLEIHHQKDQKGNMQDRIKDYIVSDVKDVPDNAKGKSEFEDDIAF